MSQPNHCVYAVELDKAVLNNKKVQQLNPNSSPDKPILYIGMTGLSPEERFKKHKAGLKANVHVQRHGLHILPEYTQSNLGFNEAEQQEEQLAKKMRAAGHTVIGGNPQLRKFADWKEFDRKRKLEEQSKPQEMPLPPQQKRVIDKLKRDDTPGQLLYHSVGSGKTLTSLNAYKALGLPTNVFVPASLRGNYRKEIDKWLGKMPSNINIQSQQRLSNTHLKTPSYANSLDIIDEAQTARDPKGKLYQTLQGTSAKKRLLLSGTPLYDNASSDLPALVNLAAGKEVLPNNPAAFNKEYFKQVEKPVGWLGKMTGVKPGLEYQLQNQDKLKAVLNKYVDYYNAPKLNFPDVSEEEVHVPMGKAQQDIYNSVLGQAPWWVRYRVSRGLPAGRGELDKLKAFMSGVRQVSNTTSGFTTRKDEVEQPKIDAAVDYFKKQLAKDNKYKAVVYSNYIAAGLDPYAKLLAKNKIPFGEFSGRVSNKVREQAVKDYNSGKLNALLISSSGAAGLDLKNTNLEQELDQHFNLSKMRQVEGRVARFGSHAALPPDQRKVLIQKYFADPRPSMLDRFTFNTPKGTDSYIYNQIAKPKDQKNQQIVKLLDPAQQAEPRWWRY